MSMFGDFDPDDALDHEPADAEQVTYRLHRLRTEIDALTGAADLPTFDELEPESQAMANGIGRALVDYLVAHEPDDPEQVARHLHEARRYVASSRLARWEELPADDRQVGVDLMALIIDWLDRQGAIT